MLTIVLSVVVPDPPPLWSVCSLLRALVLSSRSARSNMRVVLVVLEVKVVRVAQEL